MAFLETPPLSDAVALGFTGGSSYSVDVIMTGTRRSFRNLNDPEPLGRWVASHNAKLDAVKEELLNHWHAVGGETTPFRFSDANDHTVTQSNGKLGAVNQEIPYVAAGTGNGEPAYQLFKVYTRGT